MIHPIWFFILIIKLVFIIIYWDKVSKFFNNITLKVMLWLGELLVIGWFDILLLIALWLSLFFIPTCSGKSISPETPEPYGSNELKWIALSLLIFLFLIIILFRRQNKKDLDEPDCY